MIATLPLRLPDFLCGKCRDGSELWVEWCVLNSWSTVEVKLTIVVTEERRCWKTRSFRCFYKCHQIITNCSKNFSGKLSVRRTRIVHNSELDAALCKVCLRLTPIFFHTLQVIGHWKSILRSVSTEPWHVGQVVSCWNVRTCLGASLSCVGIALLYHRHAQF